MKQNLTFIPFFFRTLKHGNSPHQKNKKIVFEQVFLEAKLWNRQSFRNAMCLYL
jgi:hypothetical protein